ncbi:hypothetical protein L596_026963 [Steinernema carpocapsae]|uniref:Uncharacterized protein n=1 Tax=Steinernema carpocapsae TaxID=34508 RepID=A0A4U5M2X1_STECR|nr:hypothetical protein L596_026963 [Steinernema carpocapsae]
MTFCVEVRNTNRYTTQPLKLVVSNLAMTKRSTFSRVFVNLRCLKTDLDGDSETRVNANGATTVTHLLA